MNRNKLNIKMDLLRAAKTALDLNRPFDRSMIEVFLSSALREFEAHLPQEVLLKNELLRFKQQASSLTNGGLKRTRWGEKIMTIASRLGSL